MKMNLLALAHLAIHHSSGIGVACVIWCCACAAIFGLAVGATIQDMAWKRSFPSLYKQAEAIGRERAKIKREAKTKAKALR